MKVHYQVRAWNKRQRDEQQKGTRLRQLGLLALAATGIGLAWLLLVGADERERQRQRRLAREQIDRALRQQQLTEQQRLETERELLAQRLATQAAERQALELKSHLYASIGIMAGSYAHNIKNLLVRPNDLLRRCLEKESVPPEEGRMLREVQQTLGTVTERLQQILHTVRRDPNHTEQRLLDLNVVLRALARTWTDLAADRWQLDLTLELSDGPAWISGDVSHLQQAIENLLFNARDATFEMRRTICATPPGKSDGHGPGRPPTGQLIAGRRRGRGKVRAADRSPMRGQTASRDLEVSDNGRRHDAGRPPALHRDALLDQARQRPVRGTFDRHGTWPVVRGGDP